MVKPSVLVKELSMMRRVLIAVGIFAAWAGLVLASGCYGDSVKPANLELNQSTEEQLGYDPVLLAE